LSENKEDALKVLLNFSKLQRNFLERSKLKKVTLGSELDFIKSYMNLEISRYENDIKIDYILTVSPEVSLDKIFIPPNIFQPLIENAIKYGLLGYKGEEQKVIYIDIFRRDGIPVVSIQNPLEKGGGKKDITSSGMGLLIVKERIELYNQEMGVKLELKYDLPATDFKSGYRVEISIA
jgi:LytS/YehU family sensor histidine kinase